MMKATLDRFKLGNMLEGENSKEKLAMAGYRGQAPLITFMFFRFVMPLHRLRASRCSTSS